MSVSSVSKRVAKHSRGRGHRGNWKQIFQNPVKGQSQEQVWSCPDDQSNSKSNIGSTFSSMFFNIETKAKLQITSFCQRADHQPCCEGCNGECRGHHHGSVRGRNDKQNPRAYERRPQHVCRLHFNNPWQTRRLPQQSFLLIIGKLDPLLCKKPIFSPHFTGKTVDMILKG